MNPPLTAAERAARSVFVGNIPYEATEEQLKEIFAQVGPVVSFRLVYDRETGKPKGYGFCEYQDVETAQSAMRNLNNFDFTGRPLRVGVAAGEQNKEEMKSMQQAVGAAVIESPYGEEVEPAKAPEAISKAVASLPPEQMYELMKQMKLCIQNNPNEARNMLLQNPQLAYALLQAQIVMKIVDPKVALAMLYRQSEQIPPLLNKPEAPPTSTPDNRSAGRGPGASPSLSNITVPRPGSSPGQMPAMGGPRLSDFAPGRMEGPGMSPSDVHMRPDPRMGGNDRGDLDRGMMGGPVHQESFQDHDMGMRGPGPRGQMQDIDHRRGPGPRPGRPDPRGIDNFGGPGRMDSRDDLPRIDPRDQRGPDRMDMRGGPDPHGRMDMRGGPDPRMDRRGGPDQRAGPGADPRGMDPRGRPDPRGIDPRGMDHRGMDPRDQGRNMDRPDPRGDPRGMPARGGPPPAGPPVSRPSAMAAAATLGSNLGSGAVNDQEKAALIMQVLQLSDQQIAMLPPDQRQSILILKEQIARSGGPGQMR